MPKKSAIIFLLLFFLIKNSFSQTPCTELGQNPSTAFPVCGTDTFSIASVALCGVHDIPNHPSCTSVQFNDQNPYWYKFTCFQGGTLGFSITPNTITDDYDWQIFDVTNHNADDVYTDPSLFVACDWSGESGVTGASAAGTSLVNCDGLGVPLFSSMPTLIQGHNYLILVSHFDNLSQSGYALAFKGGTASITDPVLPALDKAKAACDGIRISVKLNKKMKCSSLAADGSDFSIAPAIAPIISAEGAGCDVNFDMDSVIITLGGILPPGNYTVKIETGTDGNNLLDYCNRGIPDGQSLPVTVYPLVPTPIDSIVPVACAPDELMLVFRDPMYCSSIAANGSDFTVTGPSAVTVSGAEGICNLKGFTDVIRVKLSAPIQKGGVYQVQLKTGTDGTTIINECGVPTLAGSSISFITKDTVSANFSAKVRLGCVSDTIDYAHDGRNGVNSWQWSFDGNIKSVSKDTSLVWFSFGQKQASLIVSNGVCSDTATAAVSLDSHVTADFEATAVVCPGDPARFRELSTGPVFSRQWDFGNGITSRDSVPQPQFYQSSNNNSIIDVPVRLIVKNFSGCADTAIKTIRVAGNCYIAVPKGFSPNGDGLNDFLYPTNAYKSKDLLFRVYNRGGQLLFESRDWTNKWDGTYKGNPQDPGTYVWILMYTLIDSGKRIELKGSTVLIR